MTAESQASWRHGGTSQGRRSLHMQYSACRVVVCGAWNKRSEAVVLSRSAKSWATREVVEGPRCMGVSISVAVWELEPGSRPGSQSRTSEHGVPLKVSAHAGGAALLRGGGWLCRGQSRQVRRHCCRTQAADRDSTAIYKNSVNRRMYTCH